MKRNLKAFKVESDDGSNSEKENRIHDGEGDDFKELAQELFKEEGLGEPVQLCSCKYSCNSLAKSQVM